MVERLKQEIAILERFRLRQAAVEQGEDGVVTPAVSMLPLIDSMLESRYLLLRMQQPEKST